MHTLMAIRWRKGIKYSKLITLANTLTDRHAALFPTGGTFIYLMQRKSDAHIKIGRSIDPRRRLLELRHRKGAIGSLPDMWPLVIALSTPDMETALHRQFKAYRRDGEWFELNDFHVDQLIAAMGAGYLTEPPAIESEYQALTQVEFGYV